MNTANKMYGEMIMFKVDLDYEIRKCHKREITEKLANKLAYIHNDAAYYHNLDSGYRIPHSNESENLYKINFEVKFNKEIQKALESITYNACQFIEDLLIESAKESLLQDTDANVIINDLDNDYMKERVKESEYYLPISKDLANNIKSLTLSRYLEYKPEQLIKVNCSSYIIKFNSKALIRPLLDNYEITNCMIAIED